MASYAIYKDWEEFDDRAVTVDGMDCIIRVNSYVAHFPRGERVIHVHAVPTEAAMQTEAYLSVKRKLRDDWSTNVLDSDPEVETAILEQLLGAKA
jgi:hypothetical protein